MRKILMLAACLCLTGCLDVNTPHKHKQIFITYINGDKETIKYTSEYDPYLKQGCVIGYVDGVITETLACGVRKIVFE